MPLMGSVTIKHVLVMLLEPVGLLFALSLFELHLFWFNAFLPSVVA